MVGGGVNSNVGRLMGSCGVAKATVQCDAASRHEVTTVLDALVGDDGGTSRGGNAMVFGTEWRGGDGGDGGVEEELNVVLGGFFGGAGQGSGAGVKKHLRKLKFSVQV